MTDLLAIFRAGFVRRWHTNPELAHTCDRIDGHSARVARIILALHPSPSLGLIHAALIHDDGESVVGDMPHGAKDGHLGTEYRHAEGTATRRLWGDLPGLSGHDSLWLKFADRLDAYMWAAHHASHVLNRGGWPEARADLLGLACHLDPSGPIGRQIDLMLSQMEVRRGAA